MKARQLALVFAGRVQKQGIQKFTNLLSANYLLVALLFHFLFISITKAEEDKRCQAFKQQAPQCQIPRPGGLQAVANRAAESCGLAYTEEAQAERKRAEYAANAGIAADQAAAPVANSVARQNNASGLSCNINEATSKIEADHYKNVNNLIQRMQSVQENIIANADQLKKFESFKCYKRNSQGNIVEDSGKTSQTKQYISKLLEDLKASSDKVTERQFDLSDKAQGLQGNIAELRQNAIKACEAEGKISNLQKDQDANIDGSKTSADAKQALDKAEQAKKDFEADPFKDEAPSGAADLKQEDGSSKSLEDLFGSSESEEAIPDSEAFGDDGLEVSDGQEATGEVSETVANFDNTPSGEADPQEPGGPETTLEEFFGGGEGSEGQKTNAFGDDGPGGEADPKSDSEQFFALQDDSNISDTKAFGDSTLPESQQVLSGDPDLAALGIPQQAEAVDEFAGLQDGALPSDSNNFQQANEFAGLQDGASASDSNNFQQADEFAALQDGASSAGKVDQSNDFAGAPEGRAENRNSAATGDKLAAKSGSDTIGGGGGNDSLGGGSAKDRLGAKASAPVDNLTSDGSDAESGLAASGLSSGSDAQQVENDNGANSRLSRGEQLAADVAANGGEFTDAQVEQLSGLSPAEQDKFNQSLKTQSNAITSADQLKSPGQELASQVAANGGKFTDAQTEQLANLSAEEQNRFNQSLKEQQGGKLRQPASAPVEAAKPEVASIGDDGTLYDKDNNVIDRAQLRNEAYTEVGYSGMSNITDEDGKRYIIDRKTGRVYKRKPGGGKATAQAWEVKRVLDHNGIAYTANSAGKVVAVDKKFRRGKVLRANPNYIKPENRNWAQSLQCKAKISTGFCSATLD